MASEARSDNFIPSLLAENDTTNIAEPVYKDNATGGLYVHIVGGGAGDGSILDGVNTAIKATVLDYTNSNPLAFRLSDANGDYVSAGAGTQYTEDVATANPQIGNAIMVERDDQLAAVTPAEGDWIGLRGTQKGALWVALADASGDPITSFGGGTEYTEDVATADPQVGKALMMERDDALSSVTPIEGDWIGARGTAEGALWTQDFNSDAILVDTTAIKTAVQLIDNAIDGNYLNVNANIAGTDIVGGAGAVAAGVQRVTLASDDPAVTDLAAIEVLLGTIDADTGAIKTATELIDNAISGAGFNITQLAGAAVPIGAGVEATALRVTLATDSTGVVSIDDNGGALTVDGTVTANLSATDNGVLDDISTDTGNIDTKLGTIDTDTGNIATAVQLIDDTVYVDDADWSDGSSKHLLVGGLYQSSPQTVTDGDVAPFNITANGALHVAVQNAVTVDLGVNNDVTVTGTVDLGATDNAVLDSSVTALQLIDNAVSGAGFNITQFAGAAVPIGAGVEATALRVTLATDSTGVVSVDDNGGALTVDGTVTANLSATDNAVLDSAVTALELIDNAISGAGFNITQFGGAAVPIGAGTEAAALRVTLATDSTGVVSVDDNGGALTVDGTVTANLSATDNQVLDDILADTAAIQTAVQLLDNAVDGNYLNVNMNVAGTDVVGGAGAVAAGVQRVTLASDDPAVAKLGTMDTDTGNIALALPLVAAAGVTVDSYTHAAINLAAGANQVLVASSASHQIWVYGIHFVCSAAGTVSFQNEDDTAVSGIMPFAANSGMSVPPSGNFAMPIWKLGTDKDLEVDIVTAEVDGWIDYAIVNA
jgi:hypothetical protein